jgi:hypothetical protein
MRNIFSVHTPPLFPSSASELYRPSESRLSPTFANRGCHMVRVTYAYGHSLGFLDQSRYFLFQVAQLSSRGWVDPVPDPLLLRKSGSTRNRTRTSGSVARNSWPLDHIGGPSPVLNVGIVRSMVDISISERRYIKHTTIVTCIFKMFQHSEHSPLNKIHVHYLTLDGSQVPNFNKPKWCERQHMWLWLGT